MPFDRKVVDKREIVKRIESVTKKTKLTEKYEKKNRQKEMAMENAELLFEILHGKGSAKKRTQSLPV